MHRSLMRIPKRGRLALLVVPATGLAIVAAACGSTGTTGSVYGGSGASTGSTSGGSSAGGTRYGTGALSLKVATSGLGSYLTDAQGRTLYLFTRDSGMTSSCSGGCTSVWPPLTATTAVQAGSGASAALLGTTTNTGGQMQVTYNGHPLYYYVGDANAGDTHGEQLDQFGGLWYVVSPGGAQITR
jgi:predicted lipoprotein with Yx(FWY)xxD motif